MLETLDHGLNVDIGIGGVVRETSNTAIRHRRTSVEALHVSGRLNSGTATVPQYG